jgi:hypothetical protein
VVCNAVSAQAGPSQLTWKTTHPGLIEDIEQGHYFI